MKEQQCSCKLNLRNLMDRETLLPSGFGIGFVKKFSQIPLVFAERYYLYPVVIRKSVTQNCTSSNSSSIRKGGSLFYSWENET